MHRRTSTTPAILCGAILLLYAHTGFAETATIIETAQLYKSPAEGAPVIGQLEAGREVQLKSRSGGWKLVDTNINSTSTTTASGTSANSITGWVRSYQVRTGTIAITEKQSSGGILGGLASLSRRVSGLFSSSSENQNDNRKSGNVVATIGVRGLSEEQIKNAKPNFKELKKMEKFSTDDKAAKKYAKDGKRKPIKLADMPKSRFEE